MISNQEIKIQLYNIIENINDTVFLLTVKEIIDKKEYSNIEPKLTNRQFERINESKEQIKEGKYFSNAEADLLVEKWLLE